MWRADRHHTPATSAFLTLLREHARQANRAEPGGLG